MGRRRSIYHSTPTSARATKRRMTVLGLYYVERDKVELKPIKNDKVLMELYMPKVITKPKGKPLVPPTTNSLQKPINDMSAVEVYNTFYSGFPKYAKVFVEEEIDGEALLMLRRKDVMCFKLPIGPKVRIWESICKFIGTRP